MTGNELTPLGTTDFSAYLIKARAANPDVLILLVQGSDMINCLKQIVQFGLNKQIHVAGTQQELESLEGLPPEARIGIWMFEWYWKQPGVAARRRVRRRHPQAQRRQGADRAALVRLYLGDDLCAGGKRAEDASTRSSSPRHWAISSCRRRSSCSRTSAIIARAIIS